MAKTKEPCKKEPVQTEIPKDPCAQKNPDDPCDFLTQYKCYLEEKSKKFCDFPEQKTCQEDKPNRDEQIQDNDNQERKECVGSCDLYLVGKAWIDILRCGLLGINWNVPSVVPVVEAADVKKPSQIKNQAKPPKMGYKDLPVYISPHYEYNESKDENKWCPEAKEKLSHQYLLPKVKSYRKWASQYWTDFRDEANSMKEEAKANLNGKKSDFLKYMRDPNNLLVRNAVVALGGMTGYCISFGKGLPRRCFYTGAGLLAAGALCFPEATDYTVRSIAFSAGKFVVAAYDKFTGSNVVLRERLPCSADLPPPRPPPTPNLCPAKDKVNKTKG